MHLRPPIALPTEGAEPGRAEQSRAMMSRALDCRALSCTLEGSFSSVWTPPIARVGAFYSIFRDLQDLHSFAPLRPEKFSNFSARILLIFHNFSRKSTIF